MARAFKIESIVRPEHWDELHELLLDPRKTVDDAELWLVSTGTT